MGDTWGKYSTAKPVKNKISGHIILQRLHNKYKERLEKFPEIVQVYHHQENKENPLHRQSVPQSRRIIWFSSHECFWWVLFWTTTATCYWQTHQTSERAAHREANNHKQNLWHTTHSFQAEFWLRSENSEKKVSNFHHFLFNEERQFSDIFIQNSDFSYFWSQNSLKQNWRKGFSKIKVLTFLTFQRSEFSP